MPVSLLETLGYADQRPNVAQVAIRRFASSTFGSALLSRILRPIDIAVMRLSSGATSATALLTGLVVVRVTMAGARSGRERTVVVMAIPLRGHLAIAGINFGQRDSPAWVRNLAADGGASVVLGRRRATVVAREATADEWEEARSVAAAIYPGSRRYLDRARHRRVRVFVLERPPASAHL
jgi:deazaflavin-dependent oxidoreductase (nitroreductase family)